MLFIVHRDAFRVILPRNKVNSIYKARKYPGSHFLLSFLDPQVQNAIFWCDLLLLIVMYFSITAESFSMSDKNECEIILFSFLYDETYVKN